MYDKPSASIILNGQKLPNIPLKIRNKTGMSVFTSTIQHSTGSSSQGNLTRRRNKRHLNWKGRSKTAFICRWHDSVHREPQRFHQELLKLINEFSKIAGYKNNIQKSVVFLYVNNELTKKENKKTISFTIASKRIKCLGINLTKGVKDLYLENYKTLKKEIEKIQISGSTYCVQR